MLATVSPITDRVFEKNTTALLDTGASLCVKLLHHICLVQPLQSRFFRTVSSDVTCLSCPFLGHCPAYQTKNYKTAVFPPVWELTLPLPGEIYYPELSKHFPQI
eukprot:GHVP01052081.1.p1 GENE.GHVP01052081.1~~GHVP01052081.1.p1  ORF type:complete len:104 (+),score=3.88 GHVP01052081.1:339-650(+)